MVRPVLHLSHVTELDVLEAAEYGRVTDRQGQERWRPVGERAAFLLDEFAMNPVGFLVQRFSTLDLDTDDYEELWSGPRFDVPMLGLRDVSAGETTLAARTFFAGADSVNRRLFHAAMEAEGEEALALWRACLQAGDQLAHYACGYTLLELERPAEAYRHLRYFTELVPRDAWAWRYLGVAAEQMGERVEAVAAYRRAAELETAEEPTDAHERLDAMGEE